MVWWFHHEVVWWIHLCHYQTYIREKANTGDDNGPYMIETEGRFIYLREGEASALVGVRNVGCAGIQSVKKLESSYELNIDNIP